MLADNKSKKRIWLSKQIFINFNNLSTNQFLILE